MSTHQQAYLDQKARFIQWMDKHQQQEMNPLATDDMDLKLLLQLCLLEQRKDNLSLQAIWLLEKYVKASPQHLPTSVFFLIDHLPDTRIEGSLRILGNILIHYLKIDRPKTLQPQQKEQLIETGFYWLSNPNTSVAVLANAIEMLYLLSAEHAWVKEELSAQIQHILHQGTSPSVHARAQKIAKKLRK